MTRPATDVIENTEFLDRSGVGAHDASRRLDFPSPYALEKWLERHDRYDLWLRMKARDPEGLHEKRRMNMVPEPTVDPIIALIARAKDAKSARIRSKAQQAAALIADLRSALDAESEAEKAKAQALADINRLEKQLAEAKARLNGARLRKPSSRTPDDGTPASEIRAWAAANGVACPARGRIPAAVRDTYEAAQGHAA